MANEITEEEYCELQMEQWSKFYSGVVQYQEVRKLYSDQVSLVVTGCCSLVVVLSLSKTEGMSSSPSRADHVKPKTFKIGSDCSSAKIGI
jgi:hypothetical protein